MNASYDDLRKYLNELHAAGDTRLLDHLTIYHSDVGEYYPAEYVEFNGNDDCVLDDGHIFIMTKGGEV
ncbi:MAG: hypothetical protein GY743_23015 [Planctomycetaceae bacterium]|nr:hypothetical protein [Planctomycetaceae bacterium]